MNHPPLRRPLLQSRRAELAMAALGTALTLAGPLTGPLTGPADLAAPGTAPTLVTRERLLVTGGSASPLVDLRDSRSLRSVPSPRLAGVGEAPSAR